MSLLSDLKVKREDAIELIAGVDIDIAAIKQTLEREQETRSFWVTYIAEIDTAIAALTPAPVPVEIEIPEGFTKWEGGECPVPYGTEIEVIHRDGDRLIDDAGFGSAEHWGHSACSGDIIAYRLTAKERAWFDKTILGKSADPDEQDDASEFAEPVPDPEFVVLDEQTCEPVDDVKPAATYGAQDDGPALNSDMQDEREEPVTDVAALIASGEHSYDEVAAIAYPEPQWNEPAPTEGYAPVTNPEADALARAHDYYSPEKVAERNKFNPFAIFRREDA